jgi:hypothetical protein
MELGRALPSSQQHGRQLAHSATIVGSGSIVGSVASASLVPSRHRRELQTSVSTSAGLTSALANTAVGRIVLASGTYMLSAELIVTRSVVLEAVVAGSAVLDAQASSSSQRRVLNINPGPSGVVQLIGLNITGGYYQSYPYGGGVSVQSGTVTITSSSIYGNTAYYVRAHVPVALLGYSHVLRFVLAGWRCRRRWRHSLNRQLPSVFQPSPLCTCQPRLQSPVPAPYFTCFALVLAGRWRCPCLANSDGYSHD